MVKILDIFNKKYITKLNQNLKIMIDIAHFLLGDPETRFAKSKSMFAKRLIEDKDGPCFGKHGTNVAQGI